MAPQFPIPPGSLPTPSAIFMATPTIASGISGAVMTMSPTMVDATTSMPIMPNAFEMDLTRINPYIYTPSFSMAILGSMAFIISATIHTIQLIKTRSWYFVVMQNAPLVVAASLIARAHSVLTLPNTGATGPFIVFMLLDMAAGTITSIGIIFTFTRLQFWVTPDDKRTFSTLWTPPLWTSFTWGFLLFVGDATKTAVQMALERTNPLSIMIQLIAQSYQLFVLSAFAFLTYRFMMISKRWVVHGECEAKNWRRLGWTVVISATIMAARHIFTIVQLDARADPLGFFSQHEWVYWATLSFPIFVVFTIFNLSYPGFFLPRPYIGFIINLKKLAIMKKDAAWPLSISPPFPMQGPEMLQDSYTETRVVEVQVGKSY